MTAPRAVRRTVAGDSRAGWCQGCRTATKNRPASYTAEEVRTAALAALAEWRDIAPVAVRDRLSTAAQNDASEAVRALASELLAQLAEPQG